MHRLSRTANKRALERQVGSATRAASESNTRSAFDVEAGNVDSNPAAGGQPSFKFGSMFSDARLEPYRPDDKGLIELGRAMQNGPDLGEHPSLLAGYTYLGQFIAHDLSWDKTGDVPKGPVSPASVEQGRSPFLDLDSVYGDGPDSPDSRLYNSDQVNLQVGTTAPSVFGDANRSYENDLPRDKENAENPRRAVIADPRNDENLAVAQVHVAFLRFHNSVAAALSLDGLFGKDLFKETRRKVIKHYQWIVLYDFLPKIIDQSVLRDVLENGPRHFKLKDPRKPFMPVEFSLAAFRLGHSLLRDSYEWNRVFQSPFRGDLRRADLFDLSRLTGFSGNMDGTSLTLPSYWIVDWTRFFDFSGFNGIANNPKPNYSGRIDTTLASALKLMEGFLTQISDPQFRSLGVVDLIRGSRLGLPAGQDVAAILGVTPLPPSEVAREPHHSEEVRIS